MQPQAIQLLIPGGQADGLKIIEMPGWCGRCYIVPRQHLRALKGQQDCEQPGLYLLFGTDEETGQDQVYIGESESFFARITNHDAAKDFWNTALIFTNGLNRAAVKYLEYRAYARAKEANRARVLNVQVPQENTLAEFDRVVVEQFFDRVETILAAFNFTVFAKVEDSLKDEKLYFLQREHVDARARMLNDGGVQVLAGSIARKRETTSFLGWAKRKREQLLVEKALVDHDEQTYRFVEDVVFKSPSGAAVTIIGSSINGWDAWKDKDGVTLNDNVRGAVAVQLTV